MAIDNPPFGSHERAARRARLIERFALLDADGQALRHEEEGYWSKDKGSVGKVILASQAYARRLAAALIALGEDPQEEYCCGRGHWHLRQIAKNRARAQRLRR